MGIVQQHQGIERCPYRKGSFPLSGRYTYLYLQLKISPESDGVIGQIYPRVYFILFSLPKKWYEEARGFKPISPQ